MNRVNEIRTALALHNPEPGRFWNTAEWKAWGEIMAAAPDLLDVLRVAQPPAEVAEWAAKLLAAGHHARCATRQGLACDCYWENRVDYAVARWIIAVCTIEGAFDLDEA